VFELESKHLSHTYLSLVALATQLEKAGETVQLALYRTNRVGRSARLHRRDVLVRSRAGRRP